MTVFRIAAAMALVSMASPALAGDGLKPAGRVTATTEGVFIARDGKLLPATAGQPVFKGDRVITRAQAKAQIAMNSCTVAMAPTSILPVTDTCSTAQTLAPSSAGFAGANGAKGSTILVGVLATAAIIGGAIALSQKTKPKSP